jgi:uncharacterized protein YukE
MVIPADPDALRGRARALRALARRIDASMIRTLLAAGNDDTWRGPSAWAFQDDARRATSALDAAVDALHRAARSLEAAAAAPTP